MKTYKNLFEQICSFDNLLVAAHNAARRKRNRPEVLAFFAQFEKNAFSILNELQSQSYTPGPYWTFYIFETKKRMISAAPFRDRIVHHMLMNIIGPLMERRMIHDTYANRVGKGTHAAIRRLQHYMRQANYVLKCDLRKYFPSIDHLILKQKMRRLISDKETLWLIDRIIDGSNAQLEVNWYFPGDDLFAPLDRRRGLPIGNLTSQYFANYYLCDFDHFVKETLGCRFYIRYVDDFVILHHSKEYLYHLLSKIQNALNGFRIRLYWEKCQIRPVLAGQKFLGQVVFPTHRLLAQQNVKRFMKRMRRMQALLAGGSISQKAFEQSLMSWIGHAKQANTWNLRKGLFLQIYK